MKRNVIGKKGTGYFSPFSPLRKSSLSPFLAVAILIGFTIAAREASGVIVDKIVAVVNGQVITRREIAWSLIPIYEQYKKEYTGRRLENKMIEAEDMVMNQLIEDKLILSEAKRQGIEVTDKEIEIKLQTIKDNFETEKQFRDTLASQDITLTELRNRCKNEIMKSTVVHKEVGWKVILTPSEVRKYYDTHPEEFRTPEGVRVLNILVKKESGGRAKDEARFLIEKIKQLIESGADFEEAAKEYSEGPNAKEGGSLGLVKKGQMIKEIDGVIFSLKVGEVSDIVNSPIAYHIFKVTERTPPKISEFETVKDEVEGSIYKEKIGKNLKKWLRELRKNAYISIK